MNPIEEMLDKKKIIVCAGPGGVGKTTIAASIALRAAEHGKKTAVLTIDPARRLAQSLGLHELSNQPRKVNRRKFTAAGLEPRGELYAMMLDTKTTFDELVLHHAPTPEQAERIIANRFYRNISSTLSGTQEYMAMEKLYELHARGTYDLIVVDTPPTRNALDFLDAPRRLTDFFESRVLRWFLVPYTRAGGRMMRVANVAAVAFLRLAKRIVGSEVLNDTAEFFANLEGMYDGFKQRARQVAALLRSNQTSFVVVTSPAAEAITEAAYFATRLSESGLPFGALVANRIHPVFGDGVTATPRQMRALEAGTPSAQLLARLVGNQQRFLRVARLEERNLAALERKVPRRRRVRVPYLQREAVDFKGLAEVSARLFDAGSAPEGRTRRRRA